MTVTRALALVAMLALVTACAGPGARVTPPAPDEAVSLWVVDHGWHTAIVVRRAGVDRALWSEVDDFPDATFVEVAWGDREFYMTTPASVWMAIKAAFGSSASVLHVVGFAVPIESLFPGSTLVEQRVSRPGFAALTRFVADEHRRGPDGRAERLQRGLYGTSWFYAARSRYSLGNTCNTWIARALRTAGLPVTPDGVVTSGGVMRQITPPSRPPG